MRTARTSCAKNNRFAPGAMKIFEHSRRWTIHSLYSLSYTSIPSIFILFPSFSPPIGSPSHRSSLSPQFSIFPTAPNLLYSSSLETRSLTHIHIYDVHICIYKSHCFFFSSAYSYTQPLAFTSPKRIYPFLGGKKKRCLHGRAALYMRLSTSRIIRSIPVYGKATSLIINFSIRQGTRSIYEGRWSELRPGKMECTSYTIYNFETHIGIFERVCGISAWSKRTQYLN